jgi:hypothetical protein
VVKAIKPREEGKELRKLINRFGSNSVQPPLVCIVWSGSVIAIAPPNESTRRLEIRIREMGEEVDSAGYSHVGVARVLKGKSAIVSIDRGTRSSTSERVQVHHSSIERECVCVWVRLQRSRGVG